MIAYFTKEILCKRMFKNKLPTFIRNNHCGAPHNNYVDGALFKNDIIVINMYITQRSFAGGESREKVFRSVLNILMVVANLLLYVLILNKQIYSQSSNNGTTVCIRDQTFRK